MFENVPKWKIWEDAGLQVAWCSLQMQALSSSV
jgi:hypothetical protein